MAYSQCYSKKGGSKGNRGTKGSFFSNTGNNTGQIDPWAPAATQAAAQQETKFTRIPAIGEHDHFFINFLAQYPEQDLNCVKDYGRGAQRLQPQEFQKYTTPKNCEFKRRIEYGTSFTARSMRALNKVARDVPQNLSTVVPATDTKSILRTLIVLRELFVESTDGKTFIAACEHLDTKYEQMRNPADLKTHVRTFSKYITTNNNVHACLQLLVVHGTSLVVGAGWGLQATSLSQDYQS